MPAGVAAVKVLASNSHQGEKEFQTEVRATLEKIMLEGSFVFPHIMLMLRKKMLISIFHDIYKPGMPLHLVSTV